MVPIRSHSALFQPSAHPEMSPLQHLHLHIFNPICTKLSSFITGAISHQHRGAEVCALIFCPVRSCCYRDIQPTATAKGRVIIDISEAASFPLLSSRKAFCLWVSFSLSLKGNALNRFKCSTECLSAGALLGKGGIFIVSNFGSEETCLLLPLLPAWVPHPHPAPALSPTAHSMRVQHIKNRHPSTGGG